MAALRGSGSGSPRLPFSRTSLTLYRDALGRFTSKRQAVSTEQYEVLRARGRFVRAVERVTERMVVKVTKVGAVERAEGMVRTALAQTNVTTKLRRVKRIEVTIKGKDGREKLQRIRLSRVFDGGRVMPETLYGMVVEALHRRGFRTQYALQQVNWKRAQVSKRYVKQFQELSGVQIRVSIQR